MIDNNETRVVPPISQLRKVLFVDEPFAEALNLRHKRSQYIWELLCSNFDADLLLLKSQSYINHPVATHKGYDKLYSLSLAASSELYPESYHILAEGQTERFANMLDSKRFELIVFAGFACLPLVRVAQKILPNCRFVIDVDSYPLPRLEAKWKANKRIDSVSFLWAYTKQLIWDKLLLKRGVRFFFHNPEEARLICQAQKLSDDDCLTFQLPMEPLDREQPPTEIVDSYILFGAQQPSESNMEAARFLVSEIYPRISRKLNEKDIKLILCGCKHLADLCGGRILHFSTDSQTADEEQVTRYTFPQLAQKAVMVLLPLFQTDTEDRIAQCASAGRALVCTNKAIASWKIPENCYLAGDSPDELAKHVLKLLQHPREADVLADNLRQYYLDNFSEDGINKAVLDKIRYWIGDYDQ
jgi:hypothetical protein